MEGKLRRRDSLSSVPTTNSTKKHHPHPKRQLTRVDSSDFQKYLDCSLCNRTLVPPIYQCPTGHLSCTACKERGLPCSICKVPIGDIRSLFAEQIAESILLPCTYQKNGCTKRIAPKNKKEHEKECEYQPVRCPEISCSEKLPMNALHSHYEAKTKPVCHSGNFTGEYKLNGTPSSKSEKLRPQIKWNSSRIMFDGNSFFDEIMGSNSTYGHWYMWVWMLGSQSEARKYMFQVTVHDFSREYTYKGPVHSLVISEDEIACRGHCLMLPSRVIDSLRDNTVAYEISISKSVSRKQSETSKPSR